MPVKKARQATPNLSLRRARQEYGWSQKEVAERIGAPQTFLVSRWEQGTASPSPAYRQRLSELFGKSLKELGLLDENILPHSPLPDIYDPAIPPSPLILSPLIGRDAILQQAKQLLLDDSIFTFAFHGLPGVGKTTLATALVNDLDIQKYFKDGILWAGIGQTPNIPALLSRWTQVLEVDDNNNTDVQELDRYRHIIRTATGTKRMLLVLDDAWNIEDALAFVTAGPNCSYLLTTRSSQLATRFAGKQTCIIPELSIEEGFRLLAEIAPSVVQVETEKARALVQAVGGLPLALTLTGNYLLALARHHQHARLSTALERLQQADVRLHLTPIPTQPEQVADTSSSLIQVIGLSIEALDEQARQALQTLAIFPPRPDTFSEEAALAIARTPIETLDRLVDAGLVECNREERYTLHQTIADYARLQGISEETYQHMVDYFVRHVEVHERDYERLEADVPAILFALEWAYEHTLTDKFIRGTLAFSHFLQLRGLYELARSLLQKAGELADTIPHCTHMAAILHRLGAIEEKQGKYEQARVDLREALQLARQGSDTRLICHILVNLILVLEKQGTYNGLETYVQEGLELARQINDVRVSLRLLTIQAHIATLQGNYDQTERYFQEVLRLARNIQDHEYIAGSLINLSVVIERRGDYSQADIYLQESLALARQLGNQDQICLILLNLGSVSVNRQRYEQAQIYLQEGLALARELGDPMYIAGVLGNLGSLAILQGAYQQAQIYLQEGLALARQIGHREMIAHTLCELGNLHLKEQNVVAAIASFNEALDQATEKDILGEAHFGLAQAFLQQGKAEQAYQHAHSSLEYFSAIAHYRTSEVKAWIQMHATQNE